MTTVLFVTHHVDKYSHQRPTCSGRIMNFTGKLVTLAPPFHTDDLFDFADVIERREVERLFVEQTYSFDEMIFEQGSAPAGVWRIVSGMTVLSRCDVGREPSFARIVRLGEILGLTETLACVPFDATLRAFSAGVCQRMDHRRLVTLLYRRPRIRQRMIRVLAEKYGDALARAADAVGSCDINHIPRTSSGIK